MSAGWLLAGLAACGLGVAYLAGLAACGLGVAYLAASGRAGWQSPAWMCTNFLAPSCYSIRGPAVRDPQSAVAGAALYLGAVLV